MQVQNTQQETTKGKYETAVTGMERQASRCTTNPQLISDGQREFWGRVSGQRWRRRVEKERERKNEINKNMFLISCFIITMNYRTIYSFIL